MTATFDGPSPARSAGILLHPTSLPGPYGIGDLGPAAYGWVDALSRARQTWWQVLPLNPTGYGDSPYSSYSAFAGNPFLISPEMLMRDGVVRGTELHAGHFPAERVDYGPVIDFKQRLLGTAWVNYESGRAPALRAPFDDYCHANASWLEDYALFMALKESTGGRGWQDWPTALRLREPAALAKAAADLRGSTGRHKFGQFLFARQWTELRRYADSKAIKLIGDAPIFVAGDSADVWANSNLFLLDADGKPTVMAGVPPDYFSATGQLWGNPLYDWKRMAETGYAWWLARLKALLSTVDMVRLDHFRGFESFWAVPAGMTTAQVGEWRLAPGDDFLATVRKAFGTMPIIAEDLGIITAEVAALRDRFNLPGMRILHFAFHGKPEDKYLPHNYEQNTVVYTGTHDNDTTKGWYAGLQPHEKQFLKRYLPDCDRDICWELLRLAWGSVADYAVVPLQDVLGLGSEARMNSPGRPQGNWGWRYTPGQLRHDLLDRLADCTEVYGR